MRYLPQYREAVEKKLHLIFVPQIKKHRMTNTMPRMTNTMPGGGTADWKYVTKKMCFMAAPQTKKHRANSHDAWARRLAAGAGCGIRTHVTLLSNGFQDRLVMTASITLRIGMTYPIRFGDFISALAAARPRLFYYFITLRRLCQGICTVKPGKICKTALPEAFLLLPSVVPGSRLPIIIRFRRRFPPPAPAAAALTVCSEAAVP